MMKFLQIVSLAVICFLLGHLTGIGVYQWYIENNRIIVAKEDDRILYYEDIYGFAEMWCHDSADTRTFKDKYKRYVGLDTEYKKPCPEGGTPVTTMVTK